ncbi:Shedu anti-phage system protein SduA domain-containing protein [Acinetobacter schindleri]|jgi:hypothetical protein|uniref:Shedu anti-phage system protein SduA domain-containing protein n=1 Tax=Acinetobacter schindleri TaxID=108981 RepID=UPI0032B57647
MNNIRRDEQLWAAIYALYCLLVENKNEENLYQELFERHPIIFSVLGVDIAAPFEKSSPHSLPYDLDKEYTPEPDFVGVELPAGNVVVVELKTPFVGGITTARQDGNRAKFKAMAETYISQATEYIESIRERHEARDVVRNVLNFEKIADYKIKLIYGLSAENDANLVSKLAAGKVISTEIIFYDDLLNKLVDMYSVSRSDITSRSGWCIVFHISLNHTQPANKVFLAEYGADNEDRISVYIEDNHLIFECLNSQNKSHRLESSLNNLGSNYIRFEFSNDSNGVYMSLNVNNVEAELRLGKYKLNLDPDIGILTLGADSNGKNGAHFYMLQHYAVNRTMSIQEKLDSFYCFEKIINDTGYCLEFKPQNFMVRQISGNLMQDKEELKPISREWPLVV